MTIGKAGFGLVVGLLGALTGCGDPQSVEQVAETSEAISQDVCPTGIPAALTPAANQTLKSVLTGVGVQIYMCNATKAGGFAWTFVAPNAKLLNDDGKLVGTHFIGPTWQGNDESSVAATVAQRAIVDPSALPWLLLTATSHGSEAGRFDDVTSIQRLATVGGNAPLDGCDATNVGAVLQVPYSAEYAFYRTKDHGAVKQCAGTP